MSFTFTTSGAILFKCGKNVSTDCVSGALLVLVSDEAEALICATAKHDLVADYANLTAEGKKILQDTASSYAAMALMNYDLSGYTSRTESETMLDFLFDRVNRGLGLIRDDKIKTYLGAT